MRDKEWLAVSTGSLFIGAAPVWLVRDRIVAAIDDRPIARMVDVMKIVPGQKVADVGSGARPFIFPPAERAGEPGVVYAVDTNPKAMRKVERSAQKRGEGQCLA